MSKDNTPAGNWISVICEQWKPKQKGETIQGVIIEMDTKWLGKDEVPYIHLVDDNGEEIEILMSAATLQMLYYSGQLQIGGNLALRYNGESTTIEKAGNFAKLYQYRYIPEGQTEPIRINTQSQTNVLGVDAETLEKLKATGQAVKEAAKAKKASK